MSHSKCSESCTNQYLLKLCELIGSSQRIMGECIVDEQNEFFYVVVEVPLIDEHGEVQMIVVDFNIYIDKNKAETRYEGKIFGLDTTDDEVFFENTMRIFSSGIEVFEEYNWVVAGPPDIALPIINHLPDTVYLRIGRKHELGSLTEFSNHFMEALLDLDELILFLLDGLVHG